MIIGISGKIGAGKDEIGKIIQYLTEPRDGIDYQSVSYYDYSKQISSARRRSSWKIHKFADALKDIVCILTGCTRTQLEDIEFKNSKLSNEWLDRRLSSINEIEAAQKYYEPRIYRDLLQILGTDLLRNQLHENVWVNALFNKYTGIIDLVDGKPSGKPHIYPNWIITDVRFPNEAKAIKDRDGVMIRINRETRPAKEGIIATFHPSEIALDNYQFDYTIHNIGTIDDLIESVRTILRKEKII